MLELELPVEGAPATLELLDQELVGYVERAGTVGERHTARLRGGRGGLRRELPAKHYIGAPMQLVFEDLARASGEELAPVPAALGGRVFAHWTRRAGRAAASLTDAALTVGGTWRIQRDGAVELVPLTWPDQDLPELLLEDGDPETRWVRYAVAERCPLPGRTLRGMRTRRVVVCLGGGGARAEVSG